VQIPEDEAARAAGAKRKRPELPKTPPRKTPGRITPDTDLLSYHAELQERARAKMAKAGLGPEKIEAPTPESDSRPPGGATNLAEFLRLVFSWRRWRRGDPSSD
jgi:hypothetical protein